MSVPELSAEEQGGQMLFDSKCAACHGAMAFVLAARQGVCGHHRQFGNMPAVEGVSDEEVLQIIAYVRALQRAYGIN